MVKIGVIYLGGDPFRRYMQGKYTHCLQTLGADVSFLKLTEDTTVIAAFAQSCDGFVLPGGADVSPELYGEQRLPCCGKTLPLRDTTETALLQEILAQKKPLLGICRGAQITNTFLGGTLYQDIGTQLPDIRLNHVDFWKRGKGVHGVNVTPGSRLFDAVGERTMVNTIHHQAIKDLAPDLQAVGISDDGIIEAFEHTDYPFLVGVQWHPEHLAKKDAGQLDFFRQLIEAAR